MIQKSRGFSTRKQEKVNISINDEPESWDGSTVSEEQINKIKNKKEKELVEKIDKAQEEVKRARENGEDPDYITRCVQDISRLRAELNEINHNYITM